MTILFAVERFEIGGVISYLETLTAFLAKQGVKIIIAGGLDHQKSFPFSEHFKSPLIKIYSYPLWRKGRWLEDFSSFVGSFKTFGKIIKESRRSERFKIDLIAFNHSGPAFGIFLHPGSKNIPKAFHFHGAWDIEEQNAFNSSQGSKKNFIFRNIRLLKYKVRWFIYYLIEWLCLLNSDKIIALSGESKRLLLNHFNRLRPEKIEIFSSGVDLNYFKPPRNKFKLKRNLLLSEEVPILFDLCRFDKKKGLENLLKMASILKAKGLGFKLVIASPVDSGWFYHPELFRLYEKLNLQTSVQFIHCLGDEEKLAFFQASDLFVFSSIGYEAYPYVIMEAMACGLPVVATPVGGVPDMLRDLEAPLLLRRKTAASMAERVEWFLKLNSQKKKALSQKCRAYAQIRFHGEKCSKAIFNFYQKMLEFRL